ncbi:membrane protein [Bacillus phage Anthos]|uniref:Membrane protein n=2 Tax=Caudoviricetes TaxID=2731619 RepID=A0A7U3T8Z0_9CAUD|nr:membrane protein [Bacillus phage Anthos]
MSFRGSLKVLVIVGFLFAVGKGISYAIVHF